MHDDSQSSMSSSPHKRKGIMTEGQQPTAPPLISQWMAIVKNFLKKWLALYHPERLRQQGFIQNISLFIATLCVFLLLVGWWWSREPALFDVQATASQHAKEQGEKIVPGYVTTYTLSQIATRLLNKSGGYLSNDLLPPSAFMDNMAAWEFGVLQQIRDFAKALRNDLSRSRTQSREDPDLAKAEPKFNTDNKSWFWPAAENEYQEGIELLDHYLYRLATSKENTAQFFARADNLRDWLEDVVKRLGSLSQRLSASVEQRHQATSMAEETGEEQATTREISIKTPWLQIDDVFYEARGSSYALILLLRAIEMDFQAVLKKHNALIILQQVIRELEASQKTVWSPMVLNGAEFGLFANHSLVLSSYISRANTGLIELYSLLAGG